MDLYPFLKSMADRDFASVVICSKDHEIIYMNPAAKRRYAKSGGGDLVGKSIFDCHNPASVEAIKMVTDRFASDKNADIVHTFYNPKQNKDVYMVALRDEEGNYIGYYEKHEYRDRETAECYDFDNPPVPHK